MTSANLSTVMSLIDNYTYQIGTSLEEHFDRLEALLTSYRQCMNVNNVQDQYVLHILSKSFEKSEVRLFDECIQVIKHTPGATSDMLRTQLINVYAQKLGELQTGQLKDNGEYIIEEKALASSDMNGKGNMCTVCGKTGHDAASCWKGKKCSKCNKTGHIAKFCRSGKKKKNKSNKKDNSSDKTESSTALKPMDVVKGKLG
jgi:hypothetical protein